MATKKYCVKLDLTTAGALETHCFARGIAKNREINNAVRMYLELKEGYEISPDVMLRRLEKWSLMFRIRIKTRT